VPLGHVDWEGEVAEKDPPAIKPYLELPELVL
jgi:hypothetical protein